MFANKKAGEPNSTIEMVAPSQKGGQVTVIARGVKMEGTFVSQGDVQIEGEVEGHVKTTGALMVGSEAKITADVAAEAATIAGTVHGSITIQQQLHIKGTAKVLGDIRCATIAVEAGAMISGKIDVGSVKTGNAK